MKKYEIQILDKVLNNYRSSIKQIKDEELGTEMENLMFGIYNSRLVQEKLNILWDEMSFRANGKILLE